MRNGACPAVEVGGRVAPSGVLGFRCTTAFSACPRLTSVCPFVRPFVRPSPSRRTKRGPECKVEKTVADKVVLFEQKRPGARDVFTRTESGRKTAGPRSRALLRYRYTNIIQMHAGVAGESRADFPVAGQTGLFARCQLGFFLAAVPKTPRESYRLIGSKATRRPKSGPWIVERVGRLQSFGIAVSLNRTIPRRPTIG